MRRSLAEAGDLPCLVEWFDAYGAPAGGGTSEELVDFMKTNAVNWPKVVKEAANVKVDA